MIVAKPITDLKETELGLKKDEIAIAMCIITSEDNEKTYYMCYDWYDSGRRVVYPYKESELQFQSGSSANDDWIKVQQGGNRKDLVTSFPEWANDPMFYEKYHSPDLDDGIAEKTMHQKIDEYISQYVIKLFGSIDNAKEQVYKYRKELQLNDATERGYDRGVLSQDEIIRPILINDFYLASNMLMNKQN